MFYVGQKVVCVFDFSEVQAQEWAVLLGIEMPVKGDVYTVRATLQRPALGDVAYGLLLEEVLNLPVPLTGKGEGGLDIPLGDLLPEPGEPAFEASCFRPVENITQERDVEACA